MGKNGKAAGKKDDGGKVMMGLLAPDWLLGTARVLTYGATAKKPDGTLKYGPYNWAKGMTWSRVYDALQRHITKFWAGEDFDVCGRCRDEGARVDGCTECTGESHLYCASCCLMFLAVYQARGLGTDDRHPWPGSEQDAEGPFALSSIEEAVRRAFPHAPDGGNRAVDMVLGALLRVDRGPVYEDIPAALEGATNETSVTGASS